ncbi:phage portal protein [Cohnella abietis]|uniref:Phage portal protein n=2 Tax=Cohnella abietis TaxID=2507935 RepID=A0A3T1D215_9BACL|nr:phage portal protein [Cohnella abietis]
MTYLPDIYREVKDFIELTATEDMEFGGIEVAVNRQFDDQFVLTSSEEAVRRRERMLEILADRNTESLAFRRTRIVNRYATKPPFTIRYLQERLDFITGVPGLVIVEIDVQGFILLVRVGIDNAAVLRELEYTINKLKPANLVYQPKAYYTERIGVSHKAVSIRLNRQTKLSTTWRLGITPFAIKREEVPL